MSEKMQGVEGDSSCPCCCGDSGVPDALQAQSCPSMLPHSTEASRAACADRHTCADTSTETRAFIFCLIFVGLSDFGGFLNAVLVLYFQNYCLVIVTCDLPLQTLAQAGICGLQNCLLKGRIMCFSNPPGSKSGKK